jgi:hypothetical protein
MIRNFWTDPDPEKIITDPYPDISDQINEFEKKKYSKKIIKFKTFQQNGYENVKIS